MTDYKSYIMNCMVCGDNNFIGLSTRNEHLDKHIFNFEKICENGLKCTIKNCYLNHSMLNKIIFTEFIKIKSNISNNNHYFHLCKHDNPWKGITGRCRYWKSRTYCCPFDHFEGHFELSQNNNNRTYKRTYKEMTDDISQERNIKLKNSSNESIVMNNTLQHFNTQPNLLTESNVMNNLLQPYKYYNILADPRIKNNLLKQSKLLTESHVKKEQYIKINNVKLNIDLNKNYIKLSNYVEDYKEQFDNLEYTISGYKKDISNLEFVVNDIQQQDNQQIDGLEYDIMCQNKEIEYLESIIYNLQKNNKLMVSLV